MSDDFDGLTIFPSGMGGWQVSLRDKRTDGWRVEIVGRLEDALQAGKDYIMAGARRGRKPAQNEVAETLLSALKFLSVGYNASGNEQATHTWFNNGWAISFDGFIAAACPVEGVEFDGFPDTRLLTEALTHVGKEMKMSVEGGAITIESGTFRAVVPMGDLSQAVPTPPDKAVGGLSEAFVEALQIAGRIVSDTAQNFVGASIITKADASGQQSVSVFSTNGKAIVEAYHGNAMPPNLVMPKMLAKALSKIERKPVAFGFSNETFTVHFDDGAFIRCQLFREPYPMDIIGKSEKLFHAPHTIKVPDGFLDAVRSVSMFGGPDQIVYFSDDAVKAGPDDENEEWAASLDVKKLGNGVSVSARSLLAIGDLAEEMWLGDEDDKPQRVVLMGKGFRAAISGDSGRTKAPAPQPVQQAAGAPWQPNPPVIEVEPPQGASTAPWQQTQPAPAVQLPFTPYERQNDPNGKPSMRGAPGWDTWPYTLAPGDDVNEFFADNRNHVAMKAHGIPLPQAPAPAAPTAPWLVGGGANGTASPAQSQQAPTTPAPASGAAPWQGNAGLSPSNGPFPVHTGDKPWMNNLGAPPAEAPAAAASGPEGAEDDGWGSVEY